MAAGAHYPRRHYAGSGHRGRTDQMVTAILAPSAPVGAKPHPPGSRRGYHHTRRTPVEKPRQRWHGPVDRLRSGFGAWSALPSTPAWIQEAALRANSQSGGDRYGEAARAWGVATSLCRLGQSPGTTTRTRLVMIGLSQS